MIKAAVRSILLVDEDQKARTSVKVILKKVNDIEIREADNCDSALEILEKQRINIIIAETQMKGVDGIEFTSLVRNKGFDTPVIFLSEHAEVDIVIKALKLRAFDFIEKKSQSKTLLPAVQRALTTKNLELLGKLQSLNLNSIQVSILEMLIKGLGNKEISKTVNLSEQGVKYHLGRLFKRFDSTNRTELRGKIWKLVNF